ncbi:ABC transporter ATP-binding protein [Pseudarthrobacter cellobiosi]|uniref:ABC transporter ATP-binding protein n=1 Tax=Pseudarthrobacter cellobiosi TaxID=2953654 RepID=UPI00208E06BA|nr:ATP-binding cassette domain-containing protein [Pseudarthrobacter sp. HLT1-5]MCO4254634.1 ATP-binding cassette domain-containing protein [Pseudarthrobacter sp. HLT1-5]
MSAAQNPVPEIALNRVFAGYTAEHPVFENVSFTFTGPSLIHLKGRNGSGKSTFVELVSGYLAPWSGTVTVSALNANDPNCRSRRRICRSDPALFAPMTARDHLLFACIARDSDPGPELLRADSLGMAPWLGENAGNLSTGNVRKLWYLMNTVGRFDSLVLDEPFNGVDAEGVACMAKEIRHWAASKLVVVITHSLQDLLPEAVTVRLEGLHSQPHRAGVPE